MGVLTFLILITLSKDGGWEVEAKPMPSKEACVSAASHVTRRPGKFQRVTCVEMDAKDI